MMANHWIFLILVLWAVPSTSLVCQECFCSLANISACDCSPTVTAPDGSHCLVIEDLHPENPYVQLAYAETNSSYVRIKDTYYIIVDESIYLNETTETWNIKTKRVVHGCDWDNCNQFSLYQALPDTFKLTINDAWLNENIYGNGSITECNTCSNQTCGIDIEHNLCPITTCENSTRCSMYNLWHDVDTGESCYESRCALPEFSDEYNEDNEKYQVQIEAIVYLAQDRSKFDIWQLDINCAVENCTRPNIFLEIKDQISGNVSVQPIFPPTRPTTTVPPVTTPTPPPAHPIRCYKCECSSSTCPCLSTETSSADTTYCTIKRFDIGQSVSIEYGHVDMDSTLVEIIEFPYVLVEESIMYDEATGRWNTHPNAVIYGCNWDLCNNPNILAYMPNSFQMRLPEDWLNTTVKGSGQPVRDCHQCPDGPQCGHGEFLDASRCPIQPCNTTCLVSDKYNRPDDDLQCYQSFCAPPASDDLLPIDTHRIEIEGVIYYSRPKDVEIWEIDVFCRADNCSDPQLFNELRKNLVLVPGDLALIFNQTREERPLRCFDCSCVDEQDCTCDTISIENSRTTYCTISRNYDGEHAYVYFQHMPITTPISDVREIPYVLAEESILYNDTTNKWYTRTNEITYGCDWDYCNKPSLLSFLPTSVQMTLPEAWLNTNIIGIEEAPLSCHECTDNSICSTNGSIDISSCPVQACNTSCFVSSVYHNPEINQQCYLSYCVPENNNTELGYDKYRVELQGIIYPSQPTTVELWEVYAYCGTDSCSRPEIFEDIKQQLNTTTNNLPSLFNNTGVGEPGKLHCYQCACHDDPVCACNKTVAMPDNMTYCTIIRLYDGQTSLIELEHVDINSTYVHIQEFPFMLVDESITYNEATSTWNTIPYLIVYGCNTDFCNDPRLVPSLPVNFRMRLPEDWLNTNVKGTGQPVRNCHECPDGPQCGHTDFLDTSHCPIKECNTTCLVSDKFDKPNDDLQCYQSYCIAPSADEPINTHRVEIEGILYGNRPNAEIELWEVDLYCRADDCSRPEIFKELEDKLTVETGDLSPFFNITTVTICPPVEAQLACYECACYNDPICACNTVKVAGADSTYCTIIRVNYGNSFTIDLEHIDRNSTFIYIPEFPFILAEESILYNETTAQWWTQSNIIIYGCNTNLCNHPSLVKLVPDSFKMTLSNEWLNTNVKGTGQPVRDCHECPDEPSCGHSDYLDTSRCPIKECNTTCVVSDIFDKPNDDLQCYQSYCNAPYQDTDEEDHHRVELEGIIYGHKQDVLELWEVDIYCRADNCSRPEIFKELRENITVSTSNLTELFNVSMNGLEPQRICYDCYCDDESGCACDKYTVGDAKSTYCILMRENYGDYSFVTLGHIDRNSTRVYIQEFPFLLVEESILYDDNRTTWNTRTNLVLYGCNTDLCNHPGYLPYLPTSFQMRLPESWLNTNVLGNGQPIDACHECPEAPSCGTLDFLDSSRCPIQTCNTTCVVSDLFNKPNDDEQCYQSFCAPPDSEFFQIDPHRVEMEGILYLYPMGRPVELWEIDIFCRANDCSRPTVFDEIRQQFTVTIGDIGIFYTNCTPVMPTTTTTTTTPSTTRTSTSSISTTSSTTRPTGTTTRPTGTTTSPTGTTTSPTGTTTSPTGTTTSPTGTTTSPTGTTTSPTGTTTRPTGTTTSPTGITTSPTGTTASSAGTTRSSAGSTASTTSTTSQPATTSFSTSVYTGHNILVLIFFAISLMNLY
ncbi:unnamed protein product [Adineta steineri]|uniref:Sodefrin repeats C n=1 Tax=Adineta steineri TaxID=433720 RepID=A0A813N6B1_9BILA|nr:unnamed protein product [Adineta steineri]